MDDVAAALKAGDWARAAQLHAQAGEHARAAALHERMLQFAAAAEAWLHAGDAVAAVRCALREGDRALQTRIVTRVLVMASVEALVDAAVLAAEKGRPDLAAPLYEGAGDLEASANALEAAGDLVGAARRWLQLGTHRAAGQLLERHLLTSPQDRPAMLELGGVLARFGRHDAATPLLRRAAELPELAEQALRQLALSFLAQGHPHAAELVLTELRAISAKAPADVVALGRLLERAEARAGEGNARIASRYLLLGPRAASSLGDVYTAYDELEDRRVVVTLFRPAVVKSDALRRFARVARAAAALEHARLLRLVELNLGAGFMVTATPRGPSLEDWLESGKVPPLDVTLRGVGEALLTMHRRGLCHGALNLTNIHVSDGGEVEVAEAGAGLLSPLRETESAGLQASLAMLSPELMAGAPPGPAADQYALAAVAYRLATGALPQPSRTFAWRSPSTLQPAAAVWDAPLERALSPRPEDRFPDVGALLVQLPSVPPAQPTPKSAHAPSVVTERYAPDAATSVHPGISWRAATDRLLGRRVVIGEGPGDALAVLRPAASLGFGVDPVLELDVGRGHTVVEAPTDGPLPSGAQLIGALQDVVDALEVMHVGGVMLGPARAPRLPDAAPVRWRLANLALPLIADAEGIAADVGFLSERVGALLGISSPPASLVALRQILAERAAHTSAPTEIHAAARSEWELLQAAMVEVGGGNPHT